MDTSANSIVHINKLRNSYGEIEVFALAMDVMDSSEFNQKDGRIEELYNVVDKTGGMFTFSKRRTLYNNIRRKCCFLSKIMGLSFNNAQDIDKHNYRHLLKLLKNNNLSSCCSETELKLFLNNLLSSKHNVNDSNLCEPDDNLIAEVNTNSNTNETCVNSLEHTAIGCCNDSLLSVSTFKSAQIVIDHDQFSVSHATDTAQIHNELEGIYKYFTTGNNSIDHGINGLLRTLVKFEVEENFGASALMLTQKTQKEEYRRHATTLQEHRRHVAALEEYRRHVTMLLFIAILVREIIFQLSVHMQLLMVLKCTHAIDIVNNIEINPKESSVGSAGCLHSDRVSRTDAFYNTSPIKYFIN